MYFFVFDKNCSERKFEIKLKFSVKNEIWGNINCDDKLNLIIKGANEFNCFINNLNSVIKQICDYNKIESPIVITKEIKTGCIEIIAVILGITSSIIQIVYLVKDIVKFAINKKKKENQLETLDKIKKLIAKTLKINNVQDCNDIANKIIKQIKEFTINSDLRIDIDALFSKDFDKGEKAKIR